MAQRSRRLDDYSNRTLALLTSAVAGVDGRVVTSYRAKYPLTVALDSRTLVLNPLTAGLYDLVLGARLLTHRDLLRQGPVEEQRKNRWLTLKAHRRLISTAQLELRQQFSGVEKLPGCFLPGSPVSDLRLVANQVEWLPFDMQHSASSHGPGLAAQILPDLQITGTQDDFGCVLAALEAGQLMTNVLPGLDDLPYVAIPLRFATTDHCPLLRSWQRHAADPENRDTIVGLMRCYQSKSIVRQMRQPSGKPQVTGVNLDSNRLVSARAAMRAGRQMPLFRKTGSTIEPVFDPRQHLVVITFDLNDLEHLTWNDNREEILRFLTVLLTVHQNLDVDVIVQGSADRLVETSDGRVVCLHFHTQFKALDEPFDESFWNRIMMLMRKPLALPGMKACYHALMAEDIARAFDQDDATHSYHTLVWWARRLMPGQRPEFRSHSFLERSASRIDYLMRELARCDVTLDTEASFLPSELRACGQPGDYLHGVKFE